MINRLFAFILFLFFYLIYYFNNNPFENCFSVFFKQNRVGIYNTFFKIDKFRSMKNNTPSVATLLLAKPEQYSLKVGKFF